MKCVVYVRVSTAEQAEQGTSLQTQVEKCTAYAESEGYTVANVFREEGESAKVATRPELLRAFAYIREHKDVRCLVVYKVDRISRNLEDQYVILKSLRDAGAEIRSASENIDDTPAGKLLRNMLWSFAQFDNEIRAERSLAGSKAIFQRGYWTHKPPPGYVMVRDSLTKRSVATPVPEQAPHIVWAFEKRAEGWTYARIAEGLNARGYRGRKGRSIRETNVEKFLKHPFYMGLMVSYGIEVVGKHTPLVSKDLWYRCQAVNAENAHAMPTRRVFHPSFPLRGLVRCAECGERLTASAPRGRNKHYEYYHHGSLFCPKARNIPKDLLERDFKSELVKLVPRPGMFKLVKAILLDRWQERLRSHTKDQRGIVGQLDGLRQEKDTLLTEKRRNPRLYADEDFMEQMQSIKGRIKALEVLRTEQETVEDDFEEVLTVAFKALKNPVESWESLHAVEQKVRFQQILFPEGLEYDGRSFGTVRPSPLLALLEAKKVANREATIRSVSTLAAPRGIEPRFPP